jgi:glycosyltransferase involved in cell wall biosynthesis
MRNHETIFVIIPALNEAASIGQVIAQIPDWVDHIIVGDNGSTDDTCEVAIAAGAQVVIELRKGYGSACLAALGVMGDANDEKSINRSCPDVVVFIDADLSDYPTQMDRLVDPIVGGGVDMVIGSRVLGDRERGALTLQQRFGNGLACLLIRIFWRRKHTDLGPFRAIRYQALERLSMDDKDWGWTVQMQVRAAKLKLSVVEVAVDYRKRIGKSKISGTVRGVIAAGVKILSVIFVEAWRSLRGK